MTPPLVSFLFLSARDTSLPRIVLNRGLCFPLPTHYRDGMRCLSLARQTRGTASPRVISLLGRLLRPRTDFHTCDRVTSSVHVCCSTINCASYGHDLRGSFYLLIPPSNFERMRFPSRRNSMFDHSFFFWTILLNFRDLRGVGGKQMMKGIKFFLYLVE